MSVCSVPSKDVAMNKDNKKKLVLWRCNIVQRATRLRIDLAEREKESERERIREIFHMFISRTLWDKQPSLS